MADLQQVSQREKSVMGEKKKKSKIPGEAKGRWLPTDNTRPGYMPNKKKKANKSKARGRVTDE